MKASGFVDFGTDLRNPEFATIAEGAGILGIESGDAGTGRTDDCASSQT